jgi:hypothetical protein
MLWAGWRRWPDVFVDFGWQLYTPWRLASGKVLYTDIAYFSGPLSPYWNSLWFRLFGPGLMILVAVNGVILAGVLVLLWWLGSYAVLFVPAIIIAVKLSSPKRYRTSVALLVGVVVAVALWTVHSAVDWANVVQPLPLLLIILLGITLVELIHVRELPSQASPLIPRLALCAFGLALLGKMILNSRIVHYGFAHAMPGTVMLVVALVGWIPASITRRGGYGAILQAVAFAAVGVVTLIYVRTSFGMYALKTVPVGSGVDEFFTDARGVFAAATLEQMHDRIAPNQTVAVFPEGVILNYLARRATSIPYVVFMPLDVNVFGEDRILGALERHPPDFVMLIHKDTSEFGYTYFGRDYAQRLFHWITEHYHPVWQAGAVPLEGDQFGILMLQRITPSG